ncbi:uncharacterized protein N7479_008628 [Penicillium vulpinum]|uniref:Uncharacterized protein n=1 Tax=Penicillium vulpinum TaxID=29845 RepID=A0A1V6S1Z3_9EURO|nr:uncharacterized protein N7479_008628 [Penicillium vulpinum]KAJ5950215.1 hypothetical protein N7479_008628 [Penicillium vulpinum]OQE07653.1 hypothetical protein PENVUL_c012G04859 [Penicillium vulpinum]
MAAVSSFRYSTGEITTAEKAKSFSWEAPIPVNRFWDSFSYPTARNFLANFSDHELEQLAVDPMGINPDDTTDQQKKLQLLLQLLRNKLAKEEAAISPPQSFYEVDYKRWNGIWQGIYTLENELDLPQAEETVRMLVEKRLDDSNVIPIHLLAEHLVKIWKYKEAEETARSVYEWMVSRPHLGKHSPQALNARRIIAKALWGQGPSRRSEAEALVAEIHELVYGMGGSKFAIYQEEEARLNEEMVAGLNLVIKKSY